MGLKVSYSRAKTTVKNRLCLSKGADIASATTITLGNDGNMFDITGTTTTTYITTTDWPPGSIIVLQFDGSVTVTHAGGAPAATSAALALASASNLSATANDTLTLIYDGVVWRQIAKTAI
jgi:hypothetical protein